MRKRRRMRSRTADQLEDRIVFCLRRANKVYNSDLLPQKYEQFWWQMYGQFTLWKAAVQENDRFWSNFRGGDL